MLHDYLLLNGEGSEVTKAEAKKDDDPKKKAPVRKRMFRVLEAHQHLDGRVCWEKMEKAATKHCWEDADTEMKFDKKKVLEYLTKMTKEDIFVWHGHGNENEISYPVQKPITKEEMAEAMGEKSPGVVLLLGCESHFLRETFTGKGCKIFMGFHGEPDAKKTAALAEYYMNKLYDKKTTLQQALDAAKKYWAVDLREDFLKLTIWPESGPVMEKTMYELLGVPDKK